MPSLNHKSRNNDKKRRRMFSVVIVLLMILLAPLAAEFLNGCFKGLFSGSAPSYNFSYFSCMKRLQQEQNRQQLIVVFYILFICIMILTLYRVNPKLTQTDVVEVANGIKIPVPVGNGQYGTAHFMNRKELEQNFSIATYKNGKIKGLSPNAGIIVDFRKEGKKETILYLSDPVNTEIIGATRSGKTRRELMTSIWLGILAGVNQLVVDVKGELCAFTSSFAKQNDYEVRTLDFRNPERSMRFNNLEAIVELLENSEISEAVDRAWDIVSILVGEPKGERIWTDGQCATIAAVILIVAQDAPQECKNLANVYYFLAYMCESDPETGAMAINGYLDNLPENHPARGAFQIAKIAPFKTRSSFFTSALATLRLYTAWNVADVTGKSDYSFEDTDEKKIIYFLILPDEKTTYHPIGAIYMKQLYESLAKQSFQKGGKLDRRFIFRIDELGNFPVIPGLGTMLSAGAGRNIFFELVLQDYQQLESKYKEDFRNIRTNCQLTICLKATDEQTTKNLSARLGNYTMQVNASSSSLSDGKGNAANYSNNASMAGRPLLYPDEISNIEKPDALILYGGKKAVTNLPDLSEYHANTAFGMGDEDFNKGLFLQRIRERPERKITEPKLWGVWYEYGTSNHPMEDEDEVNKVSFLN